MKINFQTACGIIAKEQGYKTWEELLLDNEAHTHYYQLAADLYVNLVNQEDTSEDREIEIKDANDISDFLLTIHTKLTAHLEDGTPMNVILCHNEDEPSFLKIEI